MKRGIPMTASNDRPGILLDRDGTLIDVVREEESGVLSVAFHPRQLRLLPGVVSGLRRFAEAGYALSIVTNQPGPAKGQFSREAVERTNAALVEMLAAEGVSIECVEVCLHHPSGGPGGDASLVGPCECRKPKPGLLERVIERGRLRRESTWMIGDSPVDVLAARAAGVHAALVFPRSRCELCPLLGGPPVAPALVDEHFDALARAVVARSGAADAG
jgi:D-glycero-D-manno-heptose 1,7-bisphosphate phosphatase